MIATINKLNWDSDFFKANIGEVTLNDSNQIDDSQVQDFNLIVIKQEKDTSIHLKNFSKHFEETKYVFVKQLTENIKSQTSCFEVFNTDDQPIDASLFYNLAYESGKYSRFKLDQHFPENSFERLYQLWVLNSVNKQFADKVFYIKHTNQSIVGFATVRKHKKHASIGLIAVSEGFQGQGIGKLLLRDVETYCLSQQISELQIPTQKKNTIACSFYKKNGYSVLEETIIKHYWNNN
ncbi:GNAT family N-acetyltransferase [Psychroserpens sp.]|uniref:GNAT family N-acetyltransferase n=1 Tax=Psychroserpens sp. TaxID=2020870 RepID=UPI00385D4E10